MHLKRSIEKCRERGIKANCTLEGKSKRIRTLVVQKLLSCLSSILGIRRLNNSVDGARLLAEAAVNALGHVDIVLGRSARTVSSLLSLDGDSLGGADL